MIQTDLELALQLLDAADCPQCVDKSGAYYDSHGEPNQCQWCYEVSTLKQTLQNEKDGVRRALQVGDYSADEIEQLSNTFVRCHAGSDYLEYCKEEQTDDK